MELFLRAQIFHSVTLNPSGLGSSTNWLAELRRAACSPLYQRMELDVPAAVCGTHLPLHVTFLSRGIIIIVVVLCICCVDVCAGEQ